MVLFGMVMRPTRQIKAKCHGIWYREGRLGLKKKKTN
jgi:hypothetical protein